MKRKFDEYNKLKKQKNTKNKKSNILNCQNKYLFIILIAIIIILLIIIFKISYKNNIANNELKLDTNNLVNLDNLDNFETNIFDNIKDTLKKSECSLMWSNQKEFLNGLIRKFKPKKILEVGVRFGGSSSIILNAIQDIPDSHLYSIDTDNGNIVGKCVNNYFPQFKNKWTLFKGNIAAKYMETIGNEIDLAFFDISHYEPGEILDFLMVLPFLKEEAIVSFHDIANQLTYAGEEGTRHEYAPYIIFNLIRGKKFYPSGENILLQNIGAIILEKNQKNYFYDYFRALGGQWEYILNEEQINLMRDFIKKYYDDICLSMFDEAIKFNRYFLKNNPIIDFYSSKAWFNYYKPKEKEELNK